MRKKIAFIGLIIVFALLTRGLITPFFEPEMTKCYRQWIEQSNYTTEEVSFEIFEKCIVEMRGNTVVINTEKLQELLKRKNGEGTLDRSP